MTPTTPAPDAFSASGLTELRCPACGAVHDVDQPRVRCDCGELLELRPPRPAASLGELLSGGARGADPSGVWDFADLVDPALPRAAQVRLGEGWTPLVESPALADWAGVARLWIKHEGQNPTGSFKDRGMTVAVSRALHAGARLLACASTGNTSASLAAYAARAGARAAVLLPAGGVASGKLAQALAHGATLIEIEGDFDAAMTLVQALAEEGVVGLVNSANPFRLEGQKTLVLEVLSALGEEAPDWLAFPAGNLGNCAAFGKALREVRALGGVSRPPRLLAVQAAGAAPFAAAFERDFGRLDPVQAQTLASAIRIGAPVSYGRAVRSIRETSGAVLGAQDTQLLGAKAALERAGFFAEPASAAGLAGLRLAVRKGTVRSEQSAAVVLTGNGLKDPELAVELAAGKLEADPAAMPARRERCAAELGVLRALLEG